MRSPRCRPDRIRSRSARRDSRRRPFRNWSSKWTRTLPSTSSLKVGAFVTEAVNVTADAAAVDTRTATLNTVINQQQINDLPLNGRNVLPVDAVDAGYAGGQRHLQPERHAAGGAQSHLRQRRPRQLHHLRAGRWASRRSLHRSGQRRAQPGCDSGVQLPDQQLFRQVRRPRRRRGQHGDQVRHQRLPRLALRIRSQLTR